MPAGKAIALAAMPTAVLMGMGFTPTLARADDQPSSNSQKADEYKDCVAALDDSKDASSSPSPSASDSKDSSAEPSPSATPSAGSKDSSDTSSSSDSGSGDKAEPTPSASPSKSASTGGDTASPSPSASESGGSLLDGIGDAIGGILTGGKSSESPSPTPSASASDSASPTKDASGTVKDTTDKVTDTVKDTVKDTTDTVSKTTEDTTKAIEKAAKEAGVSASPSPSSTTDAKDCAAATDAEGGVDNKVPVADDPWYLDASSLTLHGADYQGVVEVKTASGAKKRVLKYVISDGSEIGDLHQTVKDKQAGKTYHVQAAKGSKSTITNGATTMYTESISGNLFGLVPLTFTPDSPPPLNLPYIYFTNVKVVQAAQFGGSLHVPGMHVYTTD
jgi:hypothetical protein